MTARYKCRRYWLSRKSRASARTRIHRAKLRGHHPQKFVRLVWRAASWWRTSVLAYVGGWRFLFLDRRLPRVVSRRAAPWVHSDAWIWVKGERSDGDGRPGRACAWVWVSITAVRLKTRSIVTWIPHRLWLPWLHRPWITSGSEYRGCQI